MSLTSNETKFIVIVDPWSTGYVLAKQFIERDILVVAVWTHREFRDEVDYSKFWMNIVNVSKEDTIAQIRDLKQEMIAIIPGAESGVLFSDELAFVFGTRMNSFELSHARRNKYLMGETIRKAGVRAVEQCNATEWATVKAFLQEWNPSPYKVIVKPNESAGSDDVFLCNSEEEVYKAFHHINGAINRYGGVNEGVLVQEFLQGDEYVVDTISQDGVHKVCALWKYDKRHVNGQFNLYFGTQLHAASGDAERDLAEYIFEVLDALKIENGPGHAEVKMTPRGPVLIEIGSRCHGAGGSWKELSDRAFGWNQITRTAELYCEPEKFQTYPKYPTSVKEHAVNLHLVSFTSGVITAMPGLETLKGLPSYYRDILTVKVNGQVKTTIDYVTTPGSIQLVHPSADQVQHDYDLIHDMMAKGTFFELVQEKSEQDTMLEPQE